MEIAYSICAPSEAQTYNEYTCTCCQIYAQLKYFFVCCLKSIEMGREGQVTCCRREEYVKECQEDKM